MAKKQAKITKLKEDNLLHNGSNDTIFPATVGEAVSVNVKNKNKNLNNALADLQKTTCGWFDVVVKDDKYYHLLGFATYETYIEWRKSGDKSLILTDVITGEIDTTGEDPEPPTPPEQPVKVLLSPTNSDTTVYSPSNNMVLKGENLTNYIYISSESNRFKFRVNSENYPVGWARHLKIFPSAVINEVCSAQGSIIEIGQGDIGDINNPTVEGKIYITSPGGEFEDVTVNGSCANVAKLLYPEPGVSFRLSNNKEDEEFVFNLQGVNVVGTTTLSTNNGFYLHKEQIRYGANFNTVTVTADEINAGVDIILTCNYYHQDGTASVPEASVTPVFIQIKNNTSSPIIERTIRGRYAYVEPEDPVIDVDPTYIAKSYTGATTDKYFEFRVSAHNLDGDIDIEHASYKYEGDTELHDFDVFYNDENSSDHWLKVTDSTIYKDHIGNDAVLTIRLAVPETDTNEVSFTGNCVLSTLHAALQKTVTVQYTAQEQVYTPIYRIAREDNPCLVDSLVRVLSKKYGYYTSSAGLTQDELDIIRELPPKFMAGVKQTSVQTITDTPVEFTSLEELSFLRYLDVVGKSAFEQCTNLVNVKITSNADIGSRAFAECTSLTTVNIKAKRIASDAFANCPNLQEIHISTNGVPEITPSGSSTQADVTNMFGGAEINIYVPESLEDVYNSSPWGSIPNVTIIGKE